MADVEMHGASQVTRQEFEAIRVPLGMAEVEMHGASQAVWW